MGIRVAWCFGGLNGALVGWRLAAGLHKQWWAGDLFISVHVWADNNSDSRRGPIFREIR
jgi:hypothetical protein